MRWYADLSDTDWDRGFDLTLRLRDAFLTLRLGWITIAEESPWPPAETLPAWAWRQSLMTGRGISTA